MSEIQGAREALALLMAYKQGLLLMRRAIDAAAANVPESLNHPAVQAIYAKRGLPPQAALAGRLLAYADLREALNRLMREVDDKERLMEHLAEPPSEVNTP